MVACAGDLERASLTGQTRSKNAASRSFAKLALVAASIVLLAVVFVKINGSASASPEQISLVQMWQQPYTTTTMLWNAATDDSNTDMSSDNDDSSSSSNAFTQDLSDDSSSYEKFDTNALSDSSSSDDSSSTSLSQILPSSVLHGDGQAVHTHEWDTSKISNNDDWDSHSPDDSWSGSHNSVADKTWLGTDVKPHSWDNSQDSKLKTELRKMYNKGINAIPKSVAKEAAADADQSFFKKWAKVGKKISKGKTGLSDKQVKLYKEAEKSVERDEKKKENFVQAVHKKLTTASASSTVKSVSQAHHEQQVKDKLKAADRLAAKLSSSHHEAHRRVRASKASTAETKEPAADPGIVGDRAAVHAIAQIKNPKSMEAKMSRLRQKIEADFDNVTKFAHAVKKSLPPLKAAQM